MTVDSTTLRIGVHQPIEEVPGYFEYNGQPSIEGEDHSFHTLNRDGTRYVDSPTSSDPSSPMMTPLSFNVMMDHQHQSDSKRIEECESLKAVKIDTSYQTIANHPFMNLQPQPPQQQNEKKQEFVLKTFPVAAVPVTTTKPAANVQSYSTKYASFNKSSAGGPTVVHVSPKSSTLSSSVMENVVTSGPASRLELAGENDVDTNTNLQDRVLCAPNGVNDGARDSTKPPIHGVLSMIESEKSGLHQANEDASTARLVNTNQQQHYFQLHHHHHHRDSLGGLAPPPPYLQSDHGVTGSPPPPPPHTLNGLGLRMPQVQLVVPSGSGGGGVRGHANSQRNLKRQSLPNPSSLHSLVSSGLAPVTTLVAPPPPPSLSDASPSSTPSLKTPKEVKRHSLPVSMIKRPALAALLPSVGTSEVQWPSAMTMSMGVVGSVVTRPQVARTMTPPPQATTLFTPRSAITAAVNVGGGGVGSGRLLERSEMERTSSEMYEDEDEKRDEDFHPLSPLTSQRPCKVDNQPKGLAGGRGRGRVGGSMSSLGGFQHQAHGSGSAVPSGVVVGALTRNNLHHMHITGYKKSVATNRAMMDASNMKARENFPGFFEDAKELGSHWMFYSYGFVLVGALIWALMVPLLAPWAAVLPAAVAMIWMAQYGGYRWRRRYNNKQLIRDRQHSAVAKHAHAAAAAVLRPHHLHHGHSSSTSSSVRPNHSQQSSVSENDPSMSSILSSLTVHRHQQYQNYNSPPQFLKSQFQHQYQHYYHRQSSSSSSSSSPSVAVSATDGSPVAGWSTTMTSVSVPSVAKFSPSLPAFSEGISQVESTSPPNGSSPPPPRSFPPGTLQSSRLRDLTFGHESI